MNWLGSLLEIINKFLPGRKERILNEIKSLEKQLAEALASGDDITAASLRVQLREIRRKAENFDE